MSPLGTSNRLYRLLVGSEHRGWRVFGLGIAVSSIAYTTLFFLPNWDIFAGVWLVGFAGCVAAFPAAARLTDGAVRSSRYQFLRLTGVPASEIVRGFVLVVLYRLRFGLGCLVGLVPLFFLSSYLFSYQQAKQHCLVYLSRQLWAENFGRISDSITRLSMQAQCAAPSDIRVAGTALADIPVPLALGCLLLLVVILGVARGLAHNRSSFWARTGLAAAASVAVLLAAFAHTSSPLLWAPAACQIRCAFFYPWPPDLPPETILVFVFPLAALGAGRLARRWA